MTKAISVGALNAVNTFNVNYMITGSVVASGAATVLEPMVTVYRDFLAQHCARRDA